jgi:hypothetical protein
MAHSSAKYRRGGQCLGSAAFSKVVRQFERAQHECRRSNDARMRRPPGSLSPLSIKFGTGMVGGPALGSHQAHVIVSV